MSRVEMSAYLPSPADKVVRSILEHPVAYQRWQREHDRLMRTVSGVDHLARQVIALRSTAFILVHRKAMIEYARARQLTGPKRMRLFAMFYGCRDYANAVLMEHANYVRCSSSYLCAQHLAEELMHDAAFGEPLQLYEEWFGEYFSAFCDVELAETAEERKKLARLAALRPLLKHRLAGARQAILALPHRTEREWREVTIRKASGETQRVKAIVSRD